MTKTLQISDEIHQLIFDKFAELKGKRKGVKLYSVAEEAIKKGIELVGKEE